jgi:hypothetical protein
MNDSRRVGFGKLIGISSPAKSARFISSSALKHAPAAL